LEDIGNDNALGAVSSHRQARDSGDGFVVGTSVLDPSNDDVQYPTYGVTDTEELSRYGRQAVAVPHLPNGTVVTENKTAENITNTNPQNITSLPLSDTWLEKLFLKAYTSTYVVTQRSTQWLVPAEHFYHITYQSRWLYNSGVTSGLIHREDGRRFVTPFVFAGCLLTG